MGQKISPIGLRLGITHKHQSQWFVDPRNGSMQKTSVAHILIFRTLDYIRVEIHTAPTQNLSLFSNKPSKSSRMELAVKKNTGQQDQENLKDSKGINLNSSKNDTESQTLNDTYDPRLSGLNLKNLQEDLQLALAKYKRKTLSLLFSNPLNTSILIKQLNKPFAHASVFAKYLATQLEKRENTVKQAFNRSLRLIQNYKIRGIKIKVSGRLNGTDIAEHKSLFKGRIPLSRLDAKIDYSYETAKTLYGILGVKTWIWREEK
uniref:ribosomal protein S3 n=1 Tax=Cephaleuros diffusus TaxID=1519597 RepID=UPI003002B5E5